MRLWNLFRKRSDTPYVAPYQHFHNDYELYYLWEGKRTIFIKHRIVTLNEGDVLFINKQTIHQSLDMKDSNLHERVIINILPAFFHNWHDSIPSIDLTPLFQAPCTIVSLQGEERRQIESSLQWMEHIRMDDPIQFAHASLKLLDILFTVANQSRQTPLESWGSGKYTHTY